MLRIADLRLLLIPVTLAASAGEVRFAPPEGQKFRHLIIEEREDGALKRRFTSERVIVFHRVGEGYRAELTVLSHAGTTDKSGLMFVAAMAAFKDRTIRLMLDRDGKVLAVDEEAELWEALCQSIESIAGASRVRRDQVTTYVSPLRALPVERRRAMFGSMIAPLISGPIGAPGANPVSLPARGIDGKTALLAGEEHISLADDDILIAETHASGNLPPPNGSAIAARVAIDRRQRIDRHTGLIREASETRETWIGEGTSAAHNVARTISRIEPINP